MNRLSGYERMGESRIPSEDTHASGVGKPEIRRRSPADATAKLSSHTSICCSQSIWSTRNWTLLYVLLTILLMPNVSRLLWVARHESAKS